MTIKNQVQLITYPDSLGGNLKNLRKVLENYFPGIFKGGIHILPPFPSSGDRGFAPLTYLEIDPAFGSWEDINNLAQDYDIMLDLMINHISRQSPYFKEFLENGMKSDYADLFITPEKIWPDGDPPKEDLDKVFLRRSEPFSKYTIKETGEEIKIWTTFGKQDPSEQIDLDMHSEVGKQLVIDILTHFSRQDIKMIRLDAVAYVVKKPRTSCFFVEPEIYRFMDWISGIASELDIELLPEIHAHYSTHKKLIEREFWTYDFILPYLVLESLLNKNTRLLKEHLKSCPKKQFNMLDCHDGIPVIPDLNDIVKTSDARKVVNKCLERGANLSRIFAEKHKAEDGFDVHQIRCTYYSALGCDDDAYIAARAIQVFSPGIPQLYYVGLLAGQNDEETVKIQGDGRSINRHNYSLEEIEADIKKPVVQRLLRLIKFRNEKDVFNGEFSVEDSNDQELVLSWRKNGNVCRLQVDYPKNKTMISYKDEKNRFEQIEV